MDQIQDFTDERNKAWCIHCGRWIGGLQVNRDHVPSKTLLHKPYPANLPCVSVCKSCNEGFSLDEEYFRVFLGCVLSGSTDPHLQHDPSVARILSRSDKLRMQVEESKIEQTDLDGEVHLMWKPETERINRVVLKNARGHAFFEYGEPMLTEPTYTWSATFQTMTTAERSQFEHLQTDELWPEVGSRMMARVITGQDLSDGWVVVQEGTYRYMVAQRGLILVRTVIAEYLATEVYWNDC